MMLQELTRTHERCTDRRGDVSVMHAAPRAQRCDMLHSPRASSVGAASPRVAVTTEGPGGTSEHIKSTRPGTSATGH